MAAVIVRELERMKPMATPGPAMSGSSSPIAGDDARCASELREMSTLWFKLFVAFGKRHKIYARLES